MRSGLMFDGLGCLVGVGCEFYFACFGFTGDWFGYYNLGSGGWVCVVLGCFLGWCWLCFLGLCV